MLDMIRQGQRWFTAILVVGVGGAMVVFIGLGGPLRGSSGSAVVEVGSHRFGLREFERARAQGESQYRQALGDGFDPQAMRDPLDGLAARTLVERAILALEAERLGIPVARQEIERTVLSGGAFRDEAGRFDREAFQNWTEYEFGNQHNFMIDQRMALLALKMLRVINGHARVSEGEAREAVRRRLEGVRIAFVVLDAAERPADLEIDETQIRGFLETREPEARALYSEHPERYDVPERVRARHILLRLERDVPEARVEEVRATAEELLGQLREGADFAELAQKASEDPGSRDLGGDLGLFERGKMVKPFEDVAFALEPGALSDIVRSDFGLHIIRVEEHQQAQRTPFEAVREELAREILEGEATRAAARALAETIATSMREGRSLEEAARGEDLTLERSGWLRRRPDGFVPGLGAAQELLATAFTLAPGQSSQRIFEVGDKLALVQVLEKRDPAAEDVDAGIQQERDDLLERKLAVEAQTWVDARRMALLEDGELYVNLDLVRGTR
jgi:peptidyl-prolyl cis-trans isomerase D